ncbi:hypothetical protein ACFLV0_06985 [Chloroflexota bacterium]
MHHCVEHFCKVSTPPPPSLEELLKFYEKNWLAEGYETPEEEIRHKDYGREILTRFHEIQSTDFHPPG